MAITLVQSVAHGDSTGGAGTISLPGAPTAGNILVLAIWARTHAPTMPPGFVTDAATDANPYLLIGHRVAEAGDDADFAYEVNAGTARRFHLSEWSGVYEPDAAAWDVLAHTEYDTSAGDIVAPVAGADLKIAVIGMYTDIAGRQTTIDDPPATTIYEEWCIPAGFGPFAGIAYRTDGANVTATAGNATFHYAGFVAIHLADSGGAAPDDGPPPDYAPPGPANPLLEIWTADPDSYRWGSALWGQATWATAGWQDVTPEGVTADVAWGSQDSADGILAKTQAGLWTITTYDPDRILDPSNPDSIFYPELVPDLPIRISHRTTVLRTGLVERIEYSFADHRGVIRATDAVKDAQAIVPESSILGDTLYERIADAIAAAGIGLQLVDDIHDTPVAGQPAEELTVWAHIQNVAEETMRVAWIGRAGELVLRRWAVPLERGRRLDAPYLTDVLAIIDDAGRYSVARALDEDGVTTTERAVTPTPRYGKRIYSRSRMTIDSGDWCDAILADRATPALVYQPGDVRPITAADVEYFGTIEAGELVTIDTDEIDAQDGIVLGGRIRVLHRGAELPAWRFTFAVARRGASSLVDDETGATLVSDTDSSDPLIAD